MAGSSRLCIPEIRDALLNTRPQRSLAAMAQPIDKLRQQWTAAGQGHCLQYVDELSAAAQKQLLDQLASIDPMKASAMYKLSLIHI